MAAESSSSPSDAGATVDAVDRRRVASLGSDAWAAMLPAIRRALSRAPWEDEPDLARVRDAPTSRLVGGALREALVDRLASDVLLWRAVVSELGDGPEVPPDLAELVTTGTTRPKAQPAGSATPTDPTPPPDPVVSADPPREALERTKRRLREAREDRDTWKRRAAGADARAEVLAGEVRELQAHLREVRGQLEAASAAAADAEAVRARAVERERRRRDAEVAGLAAQLATLRREEDERRADRRRRADAVRQAALDAERAATDASQRVQDDAPPRIVPGRPSRLPRGVAPGTTEAARELLHRGRLVLIDGYNVTKQHQGQLDLETQRTWLVQQVGLLARRRGIRPRVVFDGQASGGGRPAAGLRDVQVWFTDAGITADDEIALAVAATDEPVLVITDDRELVARVTADGADVIGTRVFIGGLA